METHLHSNERLFREQHANVSSLLRAIARKNPHSLNALAFNLAGAPLNLIGNIAAFAGRMRSLITGECCWNKRITLAHAVTPANGHDHRVTTNYESLRDLCIVIPACF